ncbi:uncharacterized protein [Epargyreus clarus]|uniref:uncharacterized protein n=1 Tax=Epargyreus clarus TaxID=520877 RepID=UPI003C2B070B
MRSTHSISRKVFLLFAILSSKKPAGCNPITNSNLSDHIRDFSLKDDINSTRIKTLQKEELGRYTNFAPVRNPVRFKDTPDNALSSSSYSRGLVHHEHPGYAIHDYEESPHIGYGYEYVHDTDHGHHDFDHYPPDHYHGHHDGHHHHVNYHHKHYDHGLAAKAILWPIAGIALLGAAAALVSNPVLLQLGVVSGKRKRRDTVESYELEVNPEVGWLKKKDEDQHEENTKTVKGGVKERGNHSDFSGNVKNRVPEPTISNEKKEALFSILKPPTQLHIENSAYVRKRFISKEKNKDRLVQVPLILKENV